MHIIESVEEINQLIATFLMTSIKISGSKICELRLKAIKKISTSGRVGRKPINVNLGFNVNWSTMLSCLKMFLPVTVGVVWDYMSKLKGKQYKQNTSSKNYKTEIKILANPGLA